MQLSLHKWHLKAGEEQKETTDKMALTEGTGTVEKRDEFYLNNFLRKVNMEE